MKTQVKNILMGTFQESSFKMNVMKAQKITRSRLILFILFIKTEIFKIGQSLVVFFQKPIEHVQSVDL